VGTAKQVKIRINSWCDRVIYHCDNYLRDATHVATPLLRRVIRWLAWRIGNLAWLVRDLPRLSAYELADAHWRIRCIGWERDVQEVCKLFFSEGEVTAQEVGRVGLWEVGRVGRTWLDEGVDLVVSQLPLWLPMRCHTPIAFRGPTWVEQILELTDDPWDLVAGRSRHGLRSAVNRALKRGYAYHYSQDRAEFDDFYDRMYTPFVNSRHNELAMPTSHEDMIRFWLWRGGVLYVTLDGETVAGTVVYMDGDVCHSVEGGVLDADPELVRQGINTVADWFTICWARTQGARRLFMGSSHAWVRNGPYQYKERWGAHPVRRHRLYATWAFQAGNLSAEQCRSISEMGFLVEEKRRHYRVLVVPGHADNGEAAEPVDVEAAAQDAASKGLAGVLLRRPDGPRQWVRGEAPAPEPEVAERGESDTRSRAQPRADGQSARARRRSRQQAAATEGAEPRHTAATGPDGNRH
jgi:hypothetical protein